MENSPTPSLSLLDKLVRESSKMNSPMTLSTSRVDTLLFSSTVERKGVKLPSFRHSWADKNSGVTNKNGDTPLEGNGVPVRIADQNCLAKWRRFCGANGCPNFYPIAEHRAGSLNYYCTRDCNGPR
jgi:hypothetical protein